MAEIYTDSNGVAGTISGNKQDTKCEKCPEGTHLPPVKISKKDLSKRDDYGNIADDNRALYSHPYPFCLMNSKCIPNIKSNFEPYGIEIPNKEKNK